jgi:hypothetical protein
MKILGKELLRALFAAAAAVVLTVFFGSLIGYAVNPKAARENQAELLAFARANPVVTSAQNDAFWAEVAARPSEPDPPAVVAILQWHIALFGALALLALLVFRPQRAAAGAIGLLISILLWLVAGTVPAIVFAGASLVYVGLASMFAGLRRVAA